MDGGHTMPPENGPLLKVTHLSRPRTQLNETVTRRLGVCLFLHIVSAAIVMQLYPKVILEYFDGDDSAASKFNGWLTLASSILQFIAIPTLSSISDIVGRRVVLAGVLGLNGAAAIALGFTPNSIAAIIVCQVLTGLGGVTLPVGQAVIVDVSRFRCVMIGESVWLPIIKSFGRGNTGIKGKVAHGLGLISATVGLAICVGPVIGGALSETHRRAACFFCGAVSGLALISLQLYGWTETAPNRSSHASANGKGTAWGACRIVNPFSALSVLRETRLLMALAQCLFLLSLSVQVYRVWYNYFDYKFEWSPLEISIFISTFGLSSAIVSGALIRVLIPRCMLETQAILLGVSLQTVSGILYAFVTRGWMAYVVLFGTTLTSITEPCIQAAMTKLIDVDRQGSLQGAVMSLRIVAEGIAGPAYGQVFSLGMSRYAQKLLGTKVPGLPFLLSAVISIVSLVTVRCSLRSIQNAMAAEADHRGSTGDGDTPEDIDPLSTYSEEYGAQGHRHTLLNENDISSAGEHRQTLTEPLMKSSAPGAARPSIQSN